MRCICRKFSVGPILGTNLKYIKDKKCNGEGMPMAFFIDVFHVLKFSS